MSTKAVVLLACLLISSLAAIAPSFSAEPVRVYVDPPAVIDPSALFNVSVKIDNLVNLAGIQWALTWDPTLLRAVNMTEIMFHEVTPQSDWDNIWAISHRIDFGRAQYGYLWQNQSRAEEGGYFPISGNHTLATISFQVLGVGSCPLQFIRFWTKLSSPVAEPIEREVTDGFFSNSVPFVPPPPIQSPKVMIYVNPHRVKNESLAIGETFTVEVRIDSLTNHSGIVTSHFSLSWDPNLLRCINLAINQSWQYQEWRSVYNDLGECALNPSGGALPPQEAVFGNLTLATITFEIKGIGSCGLHLLTCWLQENASRNQMLYVPLDGYFGNMLNGDLNSDGVVDVFDALVFAKSFGACLNYLGWNEAADINGDMWIDVFDAILLGNLFGHTR